MCVKYFLTFAFLLVYIAVNKYFVYRMPVLQLQQPLALLLL